MIFHGTAIEDTVGLTESPVYEFWTGARMHLDDAEQGILWSRNY